MTDYSEPCNKQSRMNYQEVSSFGVQVQLTTAAIYGIWLWVYGLGSGILCGTCGA